MKNKDEVLKIGVGSLVGLIIGILIMLMFYPERIAELKNKEEVAIVLDNKKITADDLYNTLKERYSTNAMVELIDKTILESRYTLTDEDYSNIDNDAQSYFDYYNQVYSMSESDFLSQNGFESREEFTKVLELDYLRKKYYDEYINNTMTSEEIQNYYDNKVYAPFKVEHMLFKTEDVENAESLANEVINKLNNGESWEQVKSEYSNAVVENFDVEFDSNLESAFKSSAENLKDGEYTKSPVQTSYGYHIIYRISTSEKPTIETMDNRIRTSIKAEKEANNENLYVETLFKMREQAGLDIKDTVLKKLYETYKKSTLSE